MAVVLLVGQPRLNTTLNQSTHESLRQRIVMNYHMAGISKEEGRTVYHTQAGRSRKPADSI